MFKKIILFLPILMLTLVSTTFAHVKWFVDSESIIKESHNLTPFYYLNSTEVIVWAVISVIVVILFSIFDRIIPYPKKLMAFALEHGKGIDRVAAVILGLFLVTVSLIWNIILVPEFPVNDSFTSILQVLQVILGLMFIFNIRTFVASLFLIGVYFTLLFEVGSMPFFENIMLLSLAIYFLIRSSKDDSVLKRLDKHAVEIVRVGTGISLIIFAFTEKLTYPELGLSFLSVHDWNFMQNMGVSWFTDELFVLSTGFAEMIFGVIFILGYLTRINTVLIASFFAASVITMALQFGQWEVEDLVVYSAAILFVFYGHGKTKFFHLIWPESFLHTRELKNWFRKI